MADTKFTPGPWHHIGEDDDDFVVYAGDEYVTNVGCHSIAPVAFPDENGVVAFDVLTQANARLITAAPDLYEALKDCVEALSYTEAGPRIDAARAALAKVRGES
jgi:hypothetical protein